jgi:hypothetical protein
VVSRGTSASAACSPPCGVAGVCINRVFTLRRTDRPRLSHRRKDESIGRTYRPIPKYGFGQVFHGWGNPNINQDCLATQCG